MARTAARSAPRPRRSGSTMRKSGAVSLDSMHTPYNPPAVSPSVKGCYASDVTAKARRLTVLHVVQPPIGGAPIHVRLLSAYLAERGHDVTVAAPPDSLLAQDPSAVWRFLEMPELVREPDPRRDFAALRGLTKLFRSSPWDVVHLHSSKAGFVGRIAAQVAGTRAAIVYTPHCYSFLAHLGRWQTPMYRTMERAVGNCAHSVLVSRWEFISGYDAGVFESRRASIIPNGADLGVNAQTARRERPSENGRVPPIVGTVTRMQPQKGVDTFLHMAAAIHRTNPDVRFALVGDGPDRDAYQALAVDLGLEDVCEFTGHRTDIAALLQTLDVFVLSSRWESHPLALLEAMAAGLPTVATRVGGVPEIIRPGIDGLLVPPDDPQALASAVATILDDPSAAQVMGRSAHRRYLKRFLPEESNHETERLYMALTTPPLQASADRTFS